jgi:ABC-2 type transport system ATP-binding protein
VLLMDEPTANLDPVFRDDFLKLLQGARFLQEK